ncbi:Conserved_hypothetical protein [Hexamita inflata]|uniref:Uncharacterized protein n=1 Tax=Hexamita inflata TaxID=28002 RepID=A0ABP1K3I5_9EUKA
MNQLVPSDQNNAPFVGIQIPNINLELKLVKNQYQQFIKQFPTKDYTMKNQIEAEIILQKLLFESIEYAKELIKLKTTLRCVSSKNGFSCIYQQRRQNQIQIFNIIEVGANDQQSPDIQKKLGLLKQNVVRRSTIKNACQRSCGISSLTGKNIIQKIKRYSGRYDYIVNSSLEIIELQQLNVKKKYYKIQFYNKHDTGDLACKFTNKQTKTGFTPRQLDLIQDYVNKHDFQLI